METAWYFRLFYVHIVSFVISWLLSGTIRAKRMGAPTGKPWVIGFLAGFVLGWILMWFVPFKINVAFWIGLAIIAFGELVYGLGFLAMTEHPEKKKAVVDWGIYKVTRHPHLMHSVITTLGVIVMGWNTASPVYMFLWLYFVLDIVFTHFSMLREEKVTAEKLGQEYVDYMKRVPRYLSIK